jgi:FKBP-type peptidyl-prolyl cis-trans isomerase 2
MQQAQDGDKVKVHYHGKLRNGETFDSSEGRAPLEFTVGGGQVIRGFDDGVKGMQVGDKKTVEINAEDAYGEKDKKNIVEFPKDQFPPDMNPEPGMQLMLSNGEGQQFPVVVAEIKEDVIVLDANHPLAGQDLIFDIEMVEISPKSRIILPGQ